MRKLSGRRLLLLIGVLYVAYAAGRVLIHVAAGQPPVASLIDFVLVGGPGLAILYGGYRLPHTDLHPDTYPRIAAWSLGGLATMIGVFGLVVLNPAMGIDNPLWTAAETTAIGGVAGLAVGLKEAQAVTRAYEAEQHKRRLQRQNDRLESFSRMLAHELRNPLSIAQLYLPHASNGDDRATDRVGTALDRIEEMIDILLITARTTDAAVDGEAVSLEEAATEAWADVPVDRCQLVVEADRTVRADPIHLRHLFENLFSNAVEHGFTSRSAPPDGGEDAEEYRSTASRAEFEDAIEHGRTEVTVRVGALKDGFYVADDGPGIPEEKRDVVFDAGYTTESDSIGLGLTFVAQLADAYDWDCSVTESEDGGARFECRDVEIVAS